MAEQSWRKVNSAHLVQLVWDGFEFPDGETKVLPDMAVPLETVNEIAVEVAV